MWAQVINNAYMKPSYKVPYFFIHNVNTTNNEGTYNLPTNEYSDVGSVLGKGTDPVKVKVEDGKIVICNTEEIVPEKQTININGLSRKLYADKYDDIEED